CLVHVINLAMQMLISTYSKSLHFDPKQPDAHIPTSHDEVGLVRAIVVKIHISTSPEKNIIAHPWSGMLIIKVKRNVENYSG
ncbi:hypothetical protein L208DRAFT_1295218, partial [Tricholoma matsutake]